MLKIDRSIPRISNHPINLTLKNGDQLFIVGPNGSGKSALIQHFFANLPSDRVKWIPAHRQLWSESGRVDLTPASRQEYEEQMLSHYSSLQARYKDNNAYQRRTVSAILFDLVNKENTRARSIAYHVDNNDCSEAQKVSAESPPPFDQLNELLNLATLTVNIENSHNQEILARHPQDAPFNVIEMSDGERSAMIIAAYVITAEPGTVFLIDEPERHLHRSISQPFLSALFDLRREDCAFIISTHEIALPIATPGAQVLMLKSCEWSDNQCVAWDAEIIEPDSELPEDLKLAILGSRDRILFVEGEPTGSLDFPLYTALFPDLSVVPKGSCEEVQKAVLGLRGSQNKHHVEAFGLIDRDDRMDDVEKLAEKGVFALEVYSAEALYYCSDAIAAVARRQAESLGEDESGFIESAKQEAIEILKEHAERMAARRCERKIHHLLLQQAPNWESIKDNPAQQICVSVDSPYLEELNLFNEFAENGELDRLVARYPVRESSALATIAKALKCQHKNDYERMVIAQIRRDNELAQKLKERIGPLSVTLDQIEDPKTT